MKTQTNEAKTTKRTLQGIVASDKMKKTIVVKVERLVRHAAYKKYVTHTAKYKAHDETNDAKIGDRVEIIECRPLSRDKRWALKSVLARSTIKSGEGVEV